MKRVLFLTTALVLSFLSTAQTPQKSSATKPSTVTTQEETIFTVVEQMPEFPGGMEALYQFLAANIKYPGGPDVCVSGKVFVSFVIEKDGTVSDAKVLRKLHPAFDEEALRVVKLMPKWEPGRQDGKPVRVQFNLPINFNLK